MNPQDQNFVNALGYADGGQISPFPGLAPQSQQPPAMGGGQTLDYGMMNNSVSDMLTRNPQAQQEIQRAVQEALATGELDMASLNMIVQMAKAAAQNPALWPQLRNFLIQKGIADEDDIPPQMDQGLIITILTLDKAISGMDMSGAQPAAVQPPRGMGAGPQATGPGMLQGPGTGTSDSIPAVNMATGGQVGVSTGEYIIPASVVQAKGVDFFDGLVRKYHTPVGYKK